MTISLHQAFRSFVAAACLFLAVQETTAAPPGDAPQITFEGPRIILAVQPGDTVIVFGAAQRRGATLRLMRWQRVAADDDHDGRIEMALKEDVEPNSIWIAVNVATGAVGTGFPAESSFQRIDFPQAVLPKDVNGALDRYITGRPAVDLLVVRPRVGAWAGYAADGHEGDGDGAQNGAITLPFANLRRLHGNAQAPQHLTPRDVVIAIDVRRLEYYATEVNP